MAMNCTRLFNGIVWSRQEIDREEKVLETNCGDKMMLAGWSGMEKVGR